MYRPFSPDWAAAFKDAINADPTYSALSRNWTWPVALVMDATPAHGFSHAVAVQLNFDKGTCTSAVIMAPHTVDATFVLRADYDTWKEVARDGLDAIGAVSGGRIKFTGPLGTLMMHAKAASALIGAAQAVPTQFPDDVE